MGDASLLAGGISKALVNTAAGLSVALPALGLHHFLRHRLTIGGLALEEQLDRLLDACVREEAR
jgi:biopolymer transport protein ExbB